MNVNTSTDYALGVSLSIDQYIGAEENRECRRLSFEVYADRMRLLGWTRGGIQDHQWDAQSSHNFYGFH